MKKSKTEINNGTPSSPGLRRPNDHAPHQDPPSAARRTSSQLEGNDYKSKRAGEFMPSMVIPGVKFPGAPPPTSQASLTRQRSRSADPSRKDLTRRKTITNADAPKIVEKQQSNTLRAVTFGPTDIHKDDNIKANITVYTKPKPGQGQSQSQLDQIARRNSAEKERWTPSGKALGGFNLTPAPDHQRKHPHHHSNELPDRRSSVGSDDRMKVNGEPQEAARQAKGGEGMKSKEETPEAARHAKGGGAMKGNGEPQEAGKQGKGGGWGWSAGRKSPEKIVVPEVSISTHHQYIGPQAVIKPEPEPKLLEERVAAEAAQRNEVRKIGIKLSADKPAKSQVNLKDQGKVVNDKPAKETGGGGGSDAPDPRLESKPKEKTGEKMGKPERLKSYESVDVWWWSAEGGAGGQKDAKGHPPSTPGGGAPKDGKGQPPTTGGAPKDGRGQPATTGGAEAPTQIQTPPPPSENAGAQEQQKPRPVSPATEMLFKTQPSRSRRVIQNTPLQRAPVVQQASGRRILTETYQPEDTSVKNIKIQFSVAKDLPKTTQVIRPPPQQPPPPPPPPEEPKAPPAPPPPPPRPKSAAPLIPPAPSKPPVPPPEQKAPPPRAKSEPIIPPPPPPSPPKPSKQKVSMALPPPPPFQQTLEEPNSERQRSDSKALLDYLNTISKLSTEDLEHDAIPSPEMTEDNLQLIDILKKFQIPDQQRALDSLLDTDSVHFNFGGLMREYYSYMLRSYAPINMQDRYRSVTSPAHCFTSVDLSKIGTREQEMEKVTQAKLRKLDEKREQLRLVATDDDHFKFLKNLANDQTTLLPLTLVHMLNEQMAPIMEDVFRFYGKNLGTEHKSTKEAGFHYMKIRKRCEMYTNICGGSTINEDLSPFYK